MFQPAAKIRRKYDISRSTLATWGDSGRIRIRRLGDGGSSGKRIYNVSDIEKQLGVTGNDEKKEFYIYGRVSSSKQSGDLERQIETLQKNYPEHNIIKDIGSGLNYKRKGFETLLERIHTGNVQEIIVTYKDRLCRYGFELVESLCKFHDTKIVVLNASETEGIEQENELAEDLLAVCNFFVARNNGRRGGKNKKRKSSENQAGSVKRMGGTSQEMDGNFTVDLQSVPRLLQQKEV